MAIDLPPAIFDHEPEEQYDVRVLSPDGVVRECYGIKLACAIPSKNLIVIEDTLTGADRERILRHEKGHLNGWAH